MYQKNGISIIMFSFLFVFHFNIINKKIFENLVMKLHMKKHFKSIDNIII